MNQAEYERNERARYMKQVRECAAQSRSDRKSAQADYADYLQSTEILTERTVWLLTGNYGQGAMLVALDSIASVRANHAARLGIMLAMLDCGCPAREAAAAWNALPVDKQEAITAAIQAGIADYRDGE